MNRREDVSKAIAQLKQSGNLEDWTRPLLARYIGALEDTVRQAELVEAVFAPNDRVEIRQAQALFGLSEALEGLRKSNA